MYNLDKILHGLRHPSRVAWELGWIYHRKLRGKTGCSVIEADWDNLVILDACRYDLFRDVNTIEGEHSSVISRGSSTAEFLYRNFKTNDKTYGDTVYISANPQNRNHDVEKYFYDSIPVWKTDWDEDFQTVHPSVLTERVIEIEEEYPNKRLIIHYIQPHYPFIGESGRAIEHRTFHGGGELADPDEVQESVWNRLDNGELSEEVVWRAYRENLELTLPHVERLVDELTGKSVITSDHGNVFGRYNLYGHPTKHYLEELVKVPWLEIANDTRKTIESGKVGKKRETNETVEERLANLGYK